MAELALHQHGKSRVRVGRVWRKGSEHYFVEFSVDTMLESDMAHAFLTSSNKDMTATDTQKNTVYHVAKQFREPCSPEEFAVALARHFVAKYPKVFVAKVSVEMQPWRRVALGGQPHAHGFAAEGAEVRTARAAHDRASGATVVHGGVKGLKVLKTTQSGYAGFIHDELTTLPDVGDRIVASAVTATWRYAMPPPCYDAAFAGARAGLMEAFFGPPRTGVYSPSVQFTLMQMGKALLARVPEADSIFLNMPNLHFLPCAPPGSKFEDDVYVATSEPHGNIEAVVTRGRAAPHARL